jgi:hypothetical protein
MSSGLTSTKHFGFTPAWLRDGLQAVQRDDVRSFSGNPELAHELGMGAIQLEALGAWMRLGGFVVRDANALCLSAFGRLVAALDPHVSHPATWWAIHWRLSRGYPAWTVISAAEHGAVPAARLAELLGGVAPEASASTVRNARTALLRALEDTPLGRDLGLVRLESDGRRITGLTKLPVRYGGAPMAAVAYAVLDWARAEELRSAALESLAAADGPGPILHMSEGVLERYVMEIDSAYRGQVLRYARTAGLNEVYLEQEVTPLQVLASHYLHERDGLEWPEALAKAAEEVREDAAD